MTQVQTDVSRIRDETTDAWLVAAQVNVYMEAIRRKGKRVLLGPGDITRLFTIIAILLEANSVDNSGVEQPRPHALNEDEADGVINPPGELESNSTPSTTAFKRRIG